VAERPVGSRDGRLPLRDFGLGMRVRMLGVTMPDSAANGGPVRNL
jgi:hypothetical protein